MAYHRIRLDAQISGQSHQPTRTNSLAFAKVDCHTCSALKRHCDRQRPHCGICLSNRQKCDGFPVKLVWKDVSVSAETASPLRGLGSGQASIEVRASRFIQGRPRRKRRPKNSVLGLSGASRSALGSFRVASSGVEVSPEIADFELSWPGHEPLIQNEYVGFAEGYNDITGEAEF